MQDGHDRDAWAHTTTLKVAVYGAQGVDIKFEDHYPYSEKNLKRISETKSPTVVYGWDAEIQKGFGQLRK